MIEVIEALALVGMAPPSGEGGEGGIFGGMWMPLILIAVLFYFILYLPEKRRKQQREQMLKNMQRGDEIMTAGGIYGKITALTDKTATVEVAPNVRIKVSRQHVSLVSSAETASSKSKETEADESKDKDKDKDYRKKDK
jgi:preprotein translocase subunit YajC